MIEVVHRDSAWNLVRGAAYSVLVSAPPALAVGLHSRDWYTPWVVAFSLVPWISLSAVGVQPGILALVGREHSASAVGLNDTLLPALRLVVRNVLVVLACIGLLAAVCVQTGWAADSLGLVGRHPGLLAAMSLLATLQVANSVANAFFIATRRTRRGALSTVFGAGIPAGLLLGALAAEVRPGPVGFTLILALGHVPPLYLLMREFAGRCEPPWHETVGSPRGVHTFRNGLAHFTRSHAVWVLPGVLVAGLDTSLVAEFDLPALRPYSVGLSVAALVTGAVGALTSPYIPRLSALPEPWRSTKPTGVVLLTVLILAVFVGLMYTPVFPDSAMGSRTALLLLASATLLRLLTVPQSVQVVAAGRQRVLYMSSVGEAAINVAASITLGRTLGASGVAAGTFLGAWWAIGAHGRARAKIMKRSIPDEAWRRAVLLPGAVLTIIVLLLVIIGED